MERERTCVHPEQLKMKGFFCMCVENLCNQPYAWYKNY